MKALFCKHLGALRPADDDAETLLSKLRDGDLVKAEIKVPRNLAHHRKWWKLMQIVHENQDFYPSAEAVCTAIKLGIGHTERFGWKGGVVELPKSIAFSKMDQAEFELFYERGVDYIVGHIVPGLDRTSLKREVEELLR